MALRGNTDSIVRVPYRNGDLRANEKAEIVVPKLPAGGSHWTRDIAFSQDETKMFVSVGSASNTAETTGTFDVASLRQWTTILRRWIKATLYGARWDDETERADVLVFDPEGKGRRTYASGIRNCVGMAVNSPQQAIFGAQPTSATASEMIFLQITSRACGRAASTVGLGTISACTKTHVIRMRDRRIAAFSGDLAFGAWPHDLTSGGDDGIWRALDRTIACPLQRRGSRGSRRFALPQ